MLYLLPKCHPGVLFLGGSPYYSCGSNVGIDFDKRQFVCGHLPYVVGAISSWENSKCQSIIGPLCGVCTKVPLWFIGLAWKKPMRRVSGLWTFLVFDSHPAWLDTKMKAVFFLNLTWIPQKQFFWHWGHWPWPTEIATRIWDVYIFSRVAVCLIPYPNNT